MDWISVDIAPPDELVQVIDENGKTAYAYPTYYPFKVGKSQQGKWTSPITPCENHWDGGWMVEILGLDMNFGTVKGWKKYESKNTK